MLRIYNCLTTEHDLVLVLVAAAICALGVSGTVLIIERALSYTRTALWTALAGISMTATIWSTHFVAMLAYHEQLAMSFNVGLTAGSFVAGAAFMFAGLALAIYRRGHREAVIAGGLLIGAGVVALHYLGMAAVQLSGTITYDLDLVAASIVFSLAFGAASTYAAISHRGTGNRWLAAPLLLLMTVALHFTGMGATSLILDTDVGMTAPGISRAVLAIIVTVAAVAVLLIGIASAVFDRRLSTQMAAEADRFRTLADGTFEGIVIHRHGVILDSNPVFGEIVGLAEGETPTMLGDYLDAGVLSDIVADPGTAREIMVARRDGERFAAEICGRAIKLKDGKSGQLLAIRDISARKRTEARLNHLALHDHLTDLPNRRLFVEMAGKAMAHARRGERQFAIHALDLDGFKLVNDMHGHESGDVLLAEIGRRLQACLREEDVVARFGGDEFAILETGTRQPHDAIIVADRILEAIRKPIALPDAEVVISGSIGIAVFPDDGTAIETLLRNADTAMYRAKADGKGTYRFFEQEMDAALVIRRKLESRLRRAVTEGKLDVMYQPLVDSATQAPLGFEALVRWNDEELGNVPPSEFVPVAEETGLIVALGDFVLRRACADAATWPGELRIAVNLSAVQFRRPGLIDSVSRALEESGLPGDRLDLEITESILIENREQVLATLQQLKAMQIRISMDDFGTGYSSLSYLQSFPFDKIKIDRVFVNDILNSQRDSSIVQAVVAMGRSLSMKVVAEGVETAEQAAALGNMSCDELQGFLISKPMPANEVREFIDRQSKGGSRSAA